jgi:hypothetical protein
LEVFRFIYTDIYIYIYIYVARSVVNVQNYRYAVARMSQSIPLIVVHSFGVTSLTVVNHRLIRKYLWNTDLSGFPVDPGLSLVR